MVVTKREDRRWFRRYRSFFIFGILICAFQLYLALKFLTIHSESTDDNSYNPYKGIGDPNDLDNSVNSARRLRDGFVIDDEDIIEGNINDNIQKLRRQHEKYNAINNVPKTKTNQTLRVEELDFVPACDINTKEAISAIHRAKTQRCKQELVNITCFALKGLLYPKVLPNFCPNLGLTTGKSLGCFKDEKNYRILNGYYSNLKNNNSPENCIQLCLQSGYPYAGVQYS